MTHFWAQLWQARDVNVFYRRREKNTNKKVGNIDEFLQRAGDKYNYMIIFDADSMMSGKTLIKMARLMASSPQVWLLPSTPKPCHAAAPAPAVSAAASPHVFTR